MSSAVDDLSRPAQLAYSAWRAVAVGEKHPRELLSKATFYRRRREILDVVGVDIGSPGPADEELAMSYSDELEWDPKPGGPSYIASNQVPLPLGRS